MRQNFGSILAVAVQQHHDVETALDEVLVARLLIASITQILGVFQDLEFRNID